MKSIIRPLCYLGIVGLILYVLAPLSFQEIKDAIGRSKNHKKQLGEIAAFEGDWLLVDGSKTQVELIHDDGVVIYNLPSKLRVTAEKLSPIEGEYEISMRDLENLPSLITNESFVVNIDENGFWGGGVLFQVLFRFENNKRIMKISLPVDQRLETFTMAHVATYRKQ